MALVHSPPCPESASRPHVFFQRRGRTHIPPRLPGPEGTEDEREYEGLIACSVLCALVQPREVHLHLKALYFFCLALSRALTYMHEYHGFHKASQGFVLQLLRLGHFSLELQETDKLGD